MHILVNRIGYDGTLVSDRNDFQRSEKILRDLEIKYNLTRVAPSNEAKRRAPTKDELEMMKRTGESSQKLKLQILVSKALKGRPDIGTFITKLRSDGVSVTFNQASTGHVSGVTYEMVGVRITGTGLGHAYKWTSIRNLTGFDPVKGAEVIRDANGRVRSLPVTPADFRLDVEARVPIHEILIEVAVAPLDDLLEPEEAVSLNEPLRKNRRKKRSRRKLKF